MLEELKALPNWVCYKYPSKVPLRIKDGHSASSTNPSDWVSYEEALSFVTTYPDYGLGFVLTKESGLTCIDLDAPKEPTEDTEYIQYQTEIYNRFNSYTEYSPSGKGVHIWVKGSVDARKFTDKHIEVYSTERYMTVTFKAIRDIAIIEAQTLLNELVESIDAATGRNINSGGAIASQPEVCTDEEIISYIMKSKQATVFQELFGGNWKPYYTSQSEADLCLVNIVAFWTNNKEQVARIFLSSQLGNRKKAKRHDYLFDEKYGIVTKSFDQKVNPALFAELMEQIKEHVEAKILEHESKRKIEDNFDWPLPEGLLGDIAKFVYSAAIYPSQEVALSASIAFLAGLAGRCYNTCTQTGLNQYIVLVAGTAQGKEGASSGISKLTRPLLTTNPTLIDYIGPSVIASPQALIKHLVQAKSMFCQINEVGFWLQSLNAKWAKSNEKNLKALVLALFQKSGENDILQGSIYADKANNVPSIKSPSFSIMGDSTPEEFYKAIDEANIAEGLVSRFTIIPARDIRPVYNEFAGLQQPSAELLLALNKLIKTCVDLNMSNTVIKVLETDEANEFQLAYQKECMDKVWNDREAPDSKIWQRAHVRLLRLGALVAVGINPAMPTVKLEHYQWAKVIIDRGANALVNRFKSGEVGEVSPYIKQKKLLKEVLTNYYTSSFTTKIVDYGVTPEMFDNKIISFAYIQNYTCRYACFRNENNPPNCLRSHIEEMEKAGVLERLNVVEMLQFKKRGNWYRVLDPTLI